MSDTILDPIMCGVQITTPTGNKLVKEHPAFLDVVLPKIEHNRTWVVQFLAANEKMLKGQTVVGDEFNFKGFTFQKI